MLLFLKRGSYFRIQNLYVYSNMNYVLFGPFFAVHYYSTGAYRIRRLAWNQYIYTCIEICISSISPKAERVRGIASKYAIVTGAHCCCLYQSPLIDERQGANGVVASHQSNKTYLKKRNDTLMEKKYVRIEFLSQYSAIEEMKRAKTGLFEKFARFKRINLCEWRRTKGLDKCFFLVQVLVQIV